MFRRSLFIVTMALVALIPLNTASAQLTPCQMTCIIDPQAGDDIFHSYSLTIYVSAGSRKFIEDFATAEGCTLSCSQKPPGPVKFGGVVVQDCSQPMPSQSLIETNIVVKVCSGTTLPSILPDLVATVNTCSPDLLVKVTNQGPGAAAASKTKIVINSTHALSSEVSTPAIAAGDFTLVNAGSLPDFCSVKCTIVVVADSTEVISETDESNNISSPSGMCPKN